jgi:F-type H+-transporting ATPase subunit gamma
LPYAWSGAAKLQRAQERAISSRPYAEMMQRVLSNVAATAASDEEASNLPPLRVCEEKRVEAIVVKHDTGLPGAFNSNLLKVAHKYVDEPAANGQVRVEATGRKGRDYFRKHGCDLSGEHVGIVEKPQIEKAREIAGRMMEM